MRWRGGNCREKQKVLPSYSQSQQQKLRMRDRAEDSGIPKLSDKYIIIMARTRQHDDLCVCVVVNANDGVNFAAFAAATLLRP